MRGGDTPWKSSMLDAGCDELLGNAAMGQGRAR